MTTDCNDTLSSSTLEPTLRKLPAVPVESRRISRPLPKIPRALICKKCGTCISSYNVLFPLSSVSGYCTVLIQSLPLNPRFPLVLEPSEDFRARPLCLQKRGFIQLHCMINLASSNIHTKDIMLHLRSQGFN